VAASATAEFTAISPQSSVGQSIGQSIGPSSGQVRALSFHPLRFLASAAIVLAPLAPALAYFIGSVDGAVDRRDFEDVALVTAQLMAAGLFLGLTILTLFRRRVLKRLDDNAALLRRSELKLNAIYDSTHDAVLLQDDAGFFDCNRKALSLFGCRNREQLLGRHAADFAPRVQKDGAESRLMLSQQMQLTLEQGHRRFEFECQRLDTGAGFLAEFSLSSLDFDGRRVMRAVVRDITERKRADEADDALRESEFRWRSALEGNGDGLWDWNVADGTLYMSRRWKEIMGYSPDEVITHDRDELIKHIHPDDRAYALEVMQACLDGRTSSYSSEHRVACKDSSWKWILARGRAISRSAIGTASRLIGTFSDIAERKAAEIEIKQLAFYDPLTRLPNRRLLTDRLKQVIAASKRSGRYGALMFLDLDNFKPLNDNHGHEAGDLLLKEGAQRIAHCLREADTVARFGGDEFVVVLNELHADKAASIAQTRIIAEKIHVALAAPYVLSMPGSDTTVEHHCTASIGVMLFLGREVTPDEILARADAAMYRAKQGGRNQVFFDDADSQIKKIP